MMKRTLQLKERNGFFVLTLATSPSSVLSCLYALFEENFPSSVITFYTLVVGVEVFYSVAIATEESCLSR